MHNPAIISPTAKPFMRVEEFCATYGIGRSLFYSEVRRGNLKILKIGQRTLVATADAEAWLRMQGAYDGK